KNRKKHIFGPQPRYRRDAPAGGAVENVAEPAEIRDPMGRDAKALQAVEIFPAGPPVQQLLLALEQQPPDGVLVFGIGRPVLLDRMIPQAAAHRALRKVLPLQLGTPQRRVNRSDGPIRRVTRRRAPPPARPATRASLPRDTRSAPPDRRRAAQKPVFAGNCAHPCRARG